jgi:hypothetical protein
MKAKQPPGPLMDLANMRRQGVTHLIGFCRNDACRHQAILDVSSYPGDTEAPWFGGKAWFVPHKSFISGHKPAPLR